MKSYGWELELSWRDRISEFDYSARFVLSDGKRKILRYPNPTNSLSSDVYYNGQILGDIWGYKTVGIAQTQEEMNAHLANGGTPNWGRTGEPVTLCMPILMEKKVSTMVRILWKIMVT